MGSRLAILAFLLSNLPLAVSAGVGVWTPLGPDGGGAYSVAADPADPEVVYAGTALGVFKSIDGGESWSLIRSEPGGANVFALVGGTLYVRPLSTAQLLKSTDGGQTWSAATNLPPLVRGLVADPRVANRVWAIGRDVYRSDDGGATWTSIAKPKSPGKRERGLSSLAVDPAGPWIYVTLANAFFRSADLGKTWQLGGGIQTKDAVGWLAVDTAQPSVLYAATVYQVFRSVDRGLHWQQVGVGRLKHPVFGLLTAGGRVYVSRYGSGILHSSDQGATWTRGAGAPADAAGLAAVPGVIYAGTFADGQPGGPYRSRDGGATWERVSRGIRALSVSALAVDPSDPDVLYAGTDNVGLMRSADRGATWQAVAFPYQWGQYLGGYDILVDPSQRFVYAIVSIDWLLRSEDGGETWRVFPLSNPLFSLTLDPRQPGALWGGGFRLFHSVDRGERWTPVTVPDPSHHYLSEVQVDPGDPRILYALGYHSSDLRRRLLRSADGGQSWQRRDAGIGANVIIAMALDPAARDILYVGTEDGLYRSPDAGRTWTRLPGIAGEVREVAIAPTLPATVYVAGPQLGVRRSTDGGQTWTPLGNGLDGIQVNALAIDPQDPGLLYAGTYLHGVFTYEEP